MKRIAAFLLSCVAALGQNPVLNSGFEVPCGITWGHANGSLSHTVPFSAFFSTNFAARGLYSLQFSLDTSDYTKVHGSQWMKLQTSTTYAVSWDGLLGSGSGTPRAYIEHVTMGAGGISNFTATGSWQRFAYTFTTTNSNPIYRLVFNRSSGSGTVYIDNVGFTTDGSTNYVEAPIEGGIQFSRSDKIYHTDDSLAASVISYGAGTNTASWEVWDYWNRKVTNGTFTVSLASLGRATNTITLLPTATPGAYRFNLWYATNANTFTEDRFSVVRPITSDPTNHVAGSHSAVWSYYSSMATRAGHPWSRLMSVNQMTRWSVAEPTDGNFVYFTNQIAQATNAGNRLLLTLGSDMSHVPAFALSGTNSAVPDMAQYSNYVRAMISAYGGMVDAYEPWNEPDTEGDLVSYPNIYALMVDTVAAIRNDLDPTAKVVLLSVDWDYATNVLARLASTNNFDGFAHHFYSITDATAQTYKTQLWDLYPTKFVWNTEVGSLNKSAFQNWRWWSLSDASSGADYHRRTMAFLRHFMTAWGWNVKRTFLYESRNNTDFDETSEYTIIDIDQALKPWGAVLNAANYLLSGFTNVSRLGLDSRLAMYGFEAPGRVTVGMFTTNEASAAFVQVGASPSATWHDHLGVEYSGTNYTVTPTPVYLTSTGLTLAQLTNSISFASASDTDPPRVSISFRPVGQSTNVEVSLLALDNLSMSQSGGTDTPYGALLQYRAKLTSDGGSWSSWLAATNGGLQHSWAATDPQWIVDVEVQDGAGNVGTATARWNDGLSGGSPSTTRAILRNAVIRNSRP